MTVATQPSGIVTLVFTDIEGSTRLLEELGVDAYREALAEHRRVVREACSRHEGYEVDYEGDAFFYAFASAHAAVSAVSEAMVGLEAGPISIRVGIHTGEPGLDPPKYVGMDVHRAARIMSAAHGGQVLVSAHTVALIEPSGSEPQALSLLDLGEHRLKDIEGAVSIFQLGDGSFPPLKTISNTNLPRPASSFVGRERELQEVLSRIEGGARLLTLTGPGGSGKTRLALEVAATLVPAYRAGVFWVGLASLRDPALVTETIAQTLGAKDGLAEHVGEREMLLLLDNLEQVIEAAPELSALLAGCPNLTLLVTSRELLRVQGEVEYPVPPLAEPEAVSLFCERAQTEPSEEISELCVRLDSLPLAVELAAARTKALSPAQILERLSQRLDLLKGGRDADPRQQTLRATIEWSYELLSSEEQALFTRLSVFAGGCMLEAAEQVAGADLDTLQSLVEKSLLRFTNERYWMLETIREFAAERLETSGERRDMRHRHLDAVLSWAESAREGLFSAAESRWLREFEPEQGNVRAALVWAEEVGRIDALFDLVANVGNFWEIRGEWVEGRRWAKASLGRGGTEISPRRAKALTWAGAFARHAQAWDEARFYEEESLSIFLELGDSPGVVWALSNLSSLAAALGNYVEAERRLEEATATAHDVGSERLIAMCIGNRADLALRQGDDALAIELAESTLKRYRVLEWGSGIAWGLHLRALGLLRTGRAGDAGPSAKEGLSLAHSIGDAEVLVWFLVLFSALAADRGDEDVGATLLGAAEALCERVGASLSGAEAQLHRETTAELRRTLGDGPYEALLCEGRAISTDDAVRYALASID